MFRNNKTLIELIETDDSERFEQEFSKKKNKTEKVRYLKFSDWTYLHIACYNESIGIVKSIFNVFPDFPVDIQDDRGLTPLVRSIAKENFEMVKFLIEKEFITPLDVAFAHDQLDIASYLVSLGAHYTELTDPEDVERLKKKSHRYELQFTGVNELKKDRIKYYFLEYTWAGGFDVTSHEFKETENELTIVFNSHKHFSPPREQEESDSLENIKDNLFYRLVGKEQFFCHLSYDEKANLDDTTKAYFIDHNNKKWIAEISKHSSLSKVE